MNLWGIIKGLVVQDTTDRSKEISLEIDPAATTGTRTTIKAAQTANRTINLPDFDFDFGAVITADSPTTLTNKTIDGDDNTIQDLGLASLKVILADANKFLVRNGSGNVISNTKAVPSGDVVGTTDTQILTNKTITVGTTNKALETDGSGNIAASSVTSTELGYVSGVTSAIQTQLNNTQPLDSDLTALAGLSSTGLISRTGSGTVAARTITAGSSKVAISNGDGVAGNPSIDVNETNLSLNNISGTLNINKGGTGQVTANAALNALLPSQTGNATKILQTDGTNTSWQTASGVIAAPTKQVFTNVSFTVGFWFNITSSSMVAGDTYTNNGHTYTVIQSTTSSTNVYMTGGLTPQASGTLTRASGTGPATVTFSEASRLGTYTTPANARLLKVTMIGAGGGGGGTANGASASGAGGGGGGGGFAIKWYASPAGSYYYSVGAGGGGGAAGNTSGSNGGTSLFDINNVLASGGSGGNGSPTTTQVTQTALGGFGGSGSSGDINGTGGSGFNGIAYGTIDAHGGDGGNSLMGGMTRGSTGHATGITGTSYGGGGTGGAQFNGGGATAGGQGASGILIVEEYY